MNDIKPRTVYLLRRTDKEDDGTDLYVGSTSKKLKERLWDHKSAVKICNSKLYTRMYEIGKHKWEIIPLLSRICDRDIICKLEMKWIGILQSDLNSISPLTNRKNKEIIKQKQVDYYHKNIQNKIHHCTVCNKSFGCNYNLQKHFESLNHSYAYLNSLD